VAGRVTRLVPTALQARRRMRPGSRSSRKGHGGYELEVIASRVTLILFYVYIPNSGLIMIGYGFKVCSAVGVAVSIVKINVYNIPSLCLRRKLLPLTVM
jgi:hypothetical protein